MKSLIGSEHTIVEDKRNKPNKTRYQLRIGSHVLYESLEKIGLTPKKSLTMSLPKVPKKYFRHFLRGYLDGDGCIYTEWLTEAKLKRLRIIFTSGSKMFLEQLNQTLMKQLSLSLKTINKGTRCHRLMYGTHDSVKILKFMYNNLRQRIFLERKWDKAFLVLKYWPRRQVVSRESAKLLCAGSIPAVAFRPVESSGGAFVGNRSLAEHFLEPVGRTKNPARGLNM